MLYTVYAYVLHMTDLDFCACITFLYSAHIVSLILSLLLVDRKAMFI